MSARYVGLLLGLCQSMIEWSFCPMPSEATRLGKHSGHGREHPASDVFTQPGLGSVSHYRGPQKHVQAEFPEASWPPNCHTDCP